MPKNQKEKIIRFEGGYIPKTKVRIPIALSRIIQKILPELRKELRQFEELGVYSAWHFLDCLKEKYGKNLPINNEIYGKPRRD